MNKDNTNLQQYLSNFNLFEQNLNASNNKPIHDLRKTALNHLLEKGFPTKHDEEWRFTDINPILSENFTLVDSNRLINIRKSDIEPLIFENGFGPQIVFIDGCYAEHLSDFKLNQTGITVGSLKIMLENDQKSLLDSFKGFETYKENAFSALNTALIKDGAVVKLEKNVIADKPIHILHIAR